MRLGWDGRARVLAPGLALRKEATVDPVTVIWVNKHLDQELMDIGCLFGMELEMAAERVSVKVP